VQGIYLQYLSIISLASVIPSLRDLLQSAQAPLLSPIADFANPLPG